MKVNTIVRSRWLKQVLIYALIGVVFLALGLNIGNGNFGSLIHRNHQTANLPFSLNYGAIQHEYQAIKQAYDGSLTAQQLQDGLAHGLANATNDPYTEYFNKSEAADFTSQLDNTFSGIGAELGKDSSGNLEIIAPLSGSPAEKAGLKSKDIVLNINGTTTSGLNLDNAVSKIRGAAGSVVTLDILRNGTQKLTIKVTRQVIKVPSVNSQILSGNIGYMQIIDFSSDTSSLASKAAQSFKHAGVKGIILDLRDDPGGEVDAAVNVSSLWLTPGQTVFTEKRGNQVVASYTATGQNTLLGIPTVVLINGGSASASEITAGALHDNKVATLLGEKSYGKGSVQEIDNLPGGAEIKITIAHWYTPDNKNISKVGITPDQVVTLQPGELSSPSDTQVTSGLNFLASH